MSLAPDTRLRGGESGTGQGSKTRSILFPAVERLDDLDNVAAPEIFADLNIDQIVDGVVSGRDQYNLRPFFHTPLRDAEDVRYRQEVFRDLESAEVLKAVEDFADAMTGIRARLDLVGKLRHRYEKERWLLNAIIRYCDALNELRARLPALLVHSAGLADLRDYVIAHTASPDFAQLERTARGLVGELAEVCYALLVRGAKITIGRYDDELDYSQQVLATFDRFRQGEVKDHRTKLPRALSMDHVQAAILEHVARLFPDLFARLDAFCTQHYGFADDTIMRFDRELQFYLAWAACLRPLRDADLPTCYPAVSSTSNEVHARDTFDLALAQKFVAARTPIVCNEFYLTGNERTLVVSGPNQGGKTTLARTFGQLHYFAALGCPVPGSEVAVPLADRIFTHFEREEKLQTLAGKLEDELIRIHDILEQATSRSVIILNEMFTSTTVQDALALGRDVLGRISGLDAVCVCVTFIDELSTLNDKTVSMVSTVDPKDPAIRTLVLVRRAADGRAYARAIAEKYGLNYQHLRERIR